MKLLMLLAAFAAGAVAHHLWTQDATDGQTREEDTQMEQPDEDAPEGPPSCHAEVAEISRAMDPVTLTGATRAAFRTEAGETLKFLIPGDSGRYLVRGEQGMLEYRGGDFICFTKDSGEVVGALYHIPAEDEEE